MTQGSKGVGPANAAGWTVFGCCLGLCVSVMLAVGLATGYLRSRALDEAARDLRAMALVLAEQVNRDIDAVDQLLLAIDHGLVVQAANGPGAIRAGVAGLLGADGGQDASRILPQLSRIVARDHVGQLIAPGAQVALEPGTAEAAEFQAVRAGPQRGSRIGRPIFQEDRRVWELPLTHRVESAQGDFLGTITALVELGHFQRTFGTFRRENHGSMTLVQEDGRLLARHPPVGALVGRRWGDMATVIAPGESAAVRRIISPVDGADRLVGAHRLARYPLVAMVTVDHAATLAPWRQQAWVLAVLGLLGMAAIIAMGRMLSRQMRARQALEGARAELSLAGERERAEQAIGEQNERFGLALAHMSEALCMFDGQGRLVVANDRLADMFGLDPAAAAPGSSLRALLAAAAGRSHLGRRDLAALARGARRLHRLGQPALAILEPADGRALSVAFRPTPGPLGGGRPGWIATVADITERRRADAQIAYMAHHDGLTGLPNRVLFLERLQQAIGRSLRGEGCAVLYLDLDHFKAVNDTLGHLVGDGLLRAITQRLQSELRKTDTLARLGGDEFALIQSMARRPEEATALAERLLGLIAEPCVVDGHQVVIGVSIGIAMVPADGQDPHQLLKHADLAMYLAKSEGRGRIRCFEPEMDARMQSRRALETDLRKALELGQFEVFYQPLMDLCDDRVRGFEALMRWRHPSRGLVSPAEFIPLAEEIGLIVPMGDWVLRRACRDAAGWPGGTRVAVNLSPAQFARSSLVEDVAAALQASGLPPARLELEITETVMLEDTEVTLAVLHRLRGLGVSIAMDDFGTGYSSLSYLRRFPFDKVKIDRSFIEGLGQGGVAGSDSEAIVRAVTELCRTLGMATVAEGVETVEQLASLRRSHCSQVQGYLFSQPRPAGEVPAMLRWLNQGSSGDGALLNQGSAAHAAPLNEAWADDTAPLNHG